MKNTTCEPNEPDTEQGGPLGYTEVHGWSSDNYTHSGPPPVIVNPDAHALSLLSWGLGQLEQCNAMMDVIGCMSGQGAYESAAQVVNFVRQFNVQAEQVLRAGVEKIHAQAWGPPSP